MEESNELHEQESKLSVRCHSECSQCKASFNERELDKPF